MTFRSFTKNLPHSPLGGITPEQSGGVRASNSPKSHLMPPKNGRGTLRAVQRYTAVPKIGPRRPRRPPDGLIPGPPGHSRPPHTPWGHCGRLGWPVVTCGGHPQPSRRSRTPFRYGCPRVCGSPAGDSGDLCRHQRDGMGSWGVLQDHHGVQ